MFFMWMMSACARGLAIFSLILLFISFFGGAGACFMMSTKVVDEKSIYLISGAILAVMGLIFVCCIYCNRNSLETAIAIVDASADFFVATKRIVIVSIVYFIISVLFFFLWVAG
jgi:hypothetical protein